MYLRHYIQFRLPPPIWKTLPMNRIDRGICVGTYRPPVGQMSQLHYFLGWNHQMCPLSVINWTQMCPLIFFGFESNVLMWNNEFDSNPPPQTFQDLSALSLFIVHINKVYTWFTHFCRELSFVVIMRFLGGTFGQNLVGGGTKKIWDQEIKC